VSLPEILYTIIISPIEQIIELCYIFIFRVLHNQVFAILGVSLGVSILTLPLYFRAEAWQKIERDIQKKLYPKIQKIKSVFFGDEQYMMISTYYKQNNYHPVYALRSSLGVLIQIPFFIAAYHYISHLEALKGVHFLFIKDLALPDAGIRLNGITINVLPILMTAINCISGTIYTRGFLLKDKIQLYVMAGVFLILLYNSPAALVLYWTTNNIFSLIKNILQKTKDSKKIVFVVLCFGVFVADVYLIFFHKGDLPNRLLAILIFSSALIIPFLSKTTNKLLLKIDELSFSSFFVACLTFTVLLGITIPSSLIASSTEEFSFIDSWTTPFHFIEVTLFQSIGFFLFWLLALYWFFPGLVRKALVFIVALVSVLSIANVFIVYEDFGFLTNMLIFSEPKNFMEKPANFIISTALSILILFLFLCIYKKNSFNILKFVQAIILIALISLSALNFVKISTGFSIVQANKESKTGVDFEPIYSFSKTGNNVLLIMLDCVPGAYIPYIFEEKPELLKSFGNFTLYKNTVSFANYTLIGALPLYGGYEYTPKAINSRTDATLLEKQTEAYLLLPTIFADNGYRVTVTDPTFDNHHISNLSIFKNDKRIKAENLSGKWTSSWMQQHPDLHTVNVSSVLNNNLIRFCFFKITPLILRSFIYDDGNWLNPKKNLGTDLTPTVINDYALLDILPSISNFNSEEDTYNSIYVHLTHENAFFQAPDYIPSDNVTNFGNSILKNDKRYHTTMASFIMLNNFFDLLKRNGVYDNTRIILASDHGRGNADYPDNITLPNGDRLQSYNALLMIKDFKEMQRDKLNIDLEFMTNADAALFAIDGIIKNPQNPWTKKALTSDKKDGATITTIGALSTYAHSKYTYNIKPNEWLHVHTNIFKIENWSNVE
jgi:YidC/Oxa1 family membrane protein insertase